MKRRIIAFGLVIASIGLRGVHADDVPERVELPRSGPPILVAPRAPKLSPELEETVQFNRYRAMFTEDREKLALLPAAAAYLTDPRCERYHNGDPGRARDQLRGAVREQMRVAGTYTVPSFTEIALKLADLPPGATSDPLPGHLGLKGPELNVYQSLRSQGVGKILKPLTSRIPGLDQLGLVNDILGSQIDNGMPAQFDRLAWRSLADAARECRPEAALLGTSPSGSAEITQESLRWIIGAAATDPGSMAARVAGDRDPHGFNLVIEPLEKWAEGRSDRQRLIRLFRDGGEIPDTLEAKVKARADLRRPVESIRTRRPVGSDVGPTTRPQGKSAESARKADEAAWAARVVTGTLNRAREADRKLAGEARAIRSQRTETPAEARIKAEAVEKNIQERLAESHRYRQMAGMALNSLANLGLDPGLVRDLSVVTDSGFQIADGIIMLTNASNPMGWLSMLSGITNLLGGFGPNPMQLILEQLHEIRRDMADFRAEVRSQFAALRGDVLSSAQRVLNRVEDLEYNLSREIGEVKAQVRWNEYRLGQVEGQISALTHQILTRFAELQQKDLVTLLASRDLNPDEFQPLNSPSTRSELLASRYGDATSLAYASAVHHAASRTMSGGDFEIPTAYGVATPRLTAGGPGALLTLAQHPTAPWSNPNDFADLARSAGLDPLPASNAPTAFDAMNRRGLVPDCTRVVNPLAWSLAAGAFLGLAEDAPEFFAESPGLRRALAEIYLRGEEFNDMANRLASPADGGVFRALIESQLAAIDRLDKQIRDTANGVASNLNGINPWKGIKDQAIPEDYPFVFWRGSATEWQNGLKARGRIDGTNDAIAERDGSVAFEPRELQALVTSGLVPRAFCLASLVQANVAMSGRRSILGGEIVLKIVDLGLPEEYVVLRGARREGTGLLKTGPGKYHDVYVYDGPVQVTFEVHYRERSGTYDYPIARKRVHSTKHIRFYYDDGEGYCRIDDERGVEFAKWLIPRIRNGDNSVKYADDHKGINPAAFIREKENWAGLKAALVAQRPSPHPDPAEGGLLPVETVEAALEERLREEVFKVTDEAYRNLKNGQSEPGDAIRAVVGCQWTLYRFVQLALPEAVRDPELRALLLGDQAAWGGASIMRQFQPKANLVDYKAPTGTKGQPGYVPESLSAPIVQAMRVQTSKLQARLQEALARRQGQAPIETYRHPVVEATLLRILATARRLDIDLVKELTDMRIDVPGYWAARTLPTWRNRSGLQLGDTVR
jgi:hypothetical protein